MIRVTSKKREVRHRHAEEGRPDVALQLELLLVAAIWRGWLDVLATLVADPGFQARFTMSVTPNAGCADVVIVGAGISDRARPTDHRRNLQLTYTILERRARIGGTWDLTLLPRRAPDSSIFTLSFPLRAVDPSEEAHADGAHIREYLTDMGPWVRHRSPHRVR